MVVLSDGHIKKERQRKDTHDKGVFERIRVDERYLKDILVSFKSNTIYNNQIFVINEEIIRGDLAETRFFYENLNLKYNEFISSINLFIEKFDKEVETNKLKEIYPRKMFPSPKDLIYKFTSQSSNDNFTKSLIPNAIDSYRNFRKEILETLMI